MSDFITFDEWVRDEIPDFKYDEDRDDYILENYDALSEAFDNWCRETDPDI